MLERSGYADAGERLSPALITEAAVFLEGRIRHTPVEESPALSERLGVPVWLKLECLQITGSFKVRGALFALSRLPRARALQGVATCSAGNHGKGLAYAARQLDIPVTIYVPSSVDEAKYRAMVALGAEVVRSRFPGYDETEAWALKEAAQSGKPFISAYDDPYIMAGNGGTTAVEVVRAVPSARTFILPVGGGGLAGGFAFYVKDQVPGAQFIACQHAGSPALQRSLNQGAAVTEMPALDTIAGGLEGGLGRRPFEVLKERVDHVALVSEAELRAGVRWMLDHHQYLIEPSSAVTIAACLSERLPPLAGPVVIFLSGRNVSLSTIRAVIRDS